jgi:Ca2+ transporting ATPase
VLLAPSGAFSLSSVQNRELTLLNLARNGDASRSDALAGSGRFRESTVLNLARNGELSRREAMLTTFGLAAGATVLANPLSASAASGAPTPEELERIRKGYKGIEYLLDNFEQETTVCRENGGECKRDADAVRKALGLRSTTDPLFQIEKVFAKVKNMDLDPDKLEAFFEASEEWNAAMSMSNSMAFISQFGEYNPGGGKDEVLKYLNESKKQVIIARDSLKVIMDALDIKA